MTRARGAAHGQWRGGRHIGDDGYVKVRQPHPRAINGYVREHLLVAEAALGRPLPRRHPVHHYGAKTDNTRLVICESTAYHALLHLRTRAFRATGNPSARPCVRCKQWVLPDQGGATFIRDGYVYHRACEAKYRLRRKQAEKQVPAVRLGR